MKTEDLILSTEDVNYMHKPTKSKLFNNLLESNSNYNELIQKIIYNKSGTAIEKIHECDPQTNAKIRTVHYDYFKNDKVRAIDEFEPETGKKIRTINFVLYKSINEYDMETGKRIRTINYDMKDDTKISSIQEYDLEYEKITKIFIFKKDGKTLSITKEIDPKTGKITKWTSYKENSKNITQSLIHHRNNSENLANGEFINFISEYEPREGKPIKTTYFHDEINLGINIKNPGNIDYRSYKKLENSDKERMAKLIDNLYRKEVKIKV